MGEEKLAKVLLHLKLQITFISIYFHHNIMCIILMKGFLL